MENFFSSPSGLNLLAHARTFYQELRSGLLAHEVFAMEQPPFEGLSSSSPNRRRARGGGRGRSRHGRPAADDFDGAPAVNVYCVLPEQPSDPVPLRVPIDPQANVNDLLQQVSLAAASVPKLGPRAFAWLRVDSISGPPLDPSASMSSFPGRQLYAVAISSQIATLNGPRGGPLPIGVGGYYTPSAQQSATAVGSVEAGEAAPWVPGEQRAVSSAHPPPPPPPPPPPSLPPPPLLPRTRARSWRASESRHRCRAQGYEAKQWSPSSPPFHHGPQSPHGAVRHAPIAPPIPPPAPIPPPTPPLGSTSGPLAPPRSQGVLLRARAQRSLVAAGRRQWPGAYAAGAWVVQQDGRLASGPAGRAARQPALRHRLLRAAAWPAVRCRAPAATGRPLSPLSPLPAPTPLSPLVGTRRCTTCRCTCRSQPRRRNGGGRCAMARRQWAWDTCRRPRRLTSEPRTRRRRRCTELPLASETRTRPSALAHPRSPLLVSLQSRRPSNATA